MSNYGPTGLGGVQSVFNEDTTGQIFNTPVNARQKSSSATYAASSHRFEVEQKRMATKPSYDPVTRMVFRKEKFVPPPALSALLERRSALAAAAEAANTGNRATGSGTFLQGGGVTASGNSGGRDNDDRDRQAPNNHHPNQDQNGDDRRGDRQPPGRNNGPPRGASGGGGGGGGGDSDPSDDDRGHGGWHRDWRARNRRRFSPRRHRSDRTSNRTSQEFPPRDTRDVFELYFGTLEEELQFYRDQFRSPWTDNMPRTIGKRDSEKKQIQSAFKSNLFSGKEVDYPKWKNRQINEIHLANLSFKDKFEETQNALDPSDKTLAELRKLDDATPMGYAYLINELERIYGGDDKTMQALKRELISQGKVRFNDYHSLVRAGLRLTHYFNHCDKFRLSAVYMSQDTEIELMESMLTDEDTDRYMKWRDEHGCVFGLKSLQEYIDWKAKLKKDGSVIQSHFNRRRQERQAQSGFKPSGYRQSSGYQPPARTMLGEAEEEYVDETRYEEDTGYQPESDEEAEYQRATALVAERYDEDNEPGEYTDEEEIDENGVESPIRRLHAHGTEYQSRVQNGLPRETYAGQLSGLASSQRGGQEDQSFLPETLHKLLLFSTSILEGLP